MANFTNLETLEWANRMPNTFFDATLKSNAILNRFTLYDGIKSKMEIPIFEATLVFDDLKCTWSPASTADIDEKEFTVSFKRWGFQNCKDELETTYRSEYLRKGQLNAETLDDQFAEWVFDYFVKLNGQALLAYSWSGDGTNIDGIRAEMLLESTYAAIDGSGVSANLTDKAFILDHLELAYKSISAINFNALFGDADRDYKPAIFLGTAAYAAYQLAIAAYGVEYTGIEKGLFKTFMGMEVIHYAPLAATELLITPISNLVLTTDDYNDANAIQTEYDKKTNSDNIWGQYMIGFSYKKYEDMVHYLTVADA